MIISSLKAGLSLVARNKRIVAVFYVVNLLCGIFVAVPMYTVLNGFVGTTLLGERLAGRFDMDFFFDLLKYNGNALGAIAAAAFAAAAVYWLVGLFLSGGALSAFAGEAQQATSTFWNGAAKYFGRFIRLTLWSLPVLVVCYCLQFLVPLAVRIFFGSDPYENITYWSGWIRIGVGYIGILLFYLCFDYARIRTVLNDELVMRRALGRSVKFVVRHLPQTFSLTLLLFVLGGIVLALYNLIADQLHAPAFFTVLLLFCVQQVYMVFRMVLKLVLYASQLNLYRTSTAFQTSAVPASTPGVKVSAATT